MVGASVFVRRDYLHLLGSDFQGAAGSRSPRASSRPSGSSRMPRSGAEQGGSRRVKKRRSPAGEGLHESSVLSKIMIRRIISGGQAGADKAGLDAAIELGIPHGGWIPKGRKTEEGPLPEEYQLKEMKTASYPKRTERNILDSDGTLIFTYGKLSGGSELTAKLANTHGFPWLHVDLKNAGIEEAVAMVKGWFEQNPAIQTLNVAGSRASKAPGIYEAVKEVLHKVFVKK